MLSCNIGQLGPLYIILHKNSLHKWKCTCQVYNYASDNEQTNKLIDNIGNQENSGPLQHMYSVYMTLLYPNYINQTANQINGPET